MVVYFFLGKKSLWSSLLASGRLFFFKKKIPMVGYYWVVAHLFFHNTHFFPLNLAILTKFALKSFLLIPGKYCLVVYKGVVDYSFWTFYRYGRLFAGGLVFRIGE